MKRIPRPGAADFFNAAGLLKSAGFLFAAAYLLFFSACSRRDGALVPLIGDVARDSALTLVWSGHGMAYRPRSGAWERDSAYDYAFTVVQQRDGARWRSVKTLQRRHPAYDGRAGARAQTLFFELDFHREGDSLVSRVESSLGAGKGRGDREFRVQQLELAAAGTGLFSPYTHFRISQQFLYEDGRLEETVDIIKRKSGEETPFMRIEERAFIYARGILPGAPTRL